MRVAVDNIIPNPYRDMDKFPINEEKVKALVESIRQTDFWDNLLARPEGNSLKVNGDNLTGEALAQHLRELEEADFPVELGYGHHRLEAVKRVGLEFIEIPVKVIDDEIMLQIMANENKGDWGYGNMSVLLETYRQVRLNIHRQAKEFEKFDDYVEKYSFFKKAKDFNAAKDISNIGYRRIHQFLGETWSENNLRSAGAVLASIDDGLFAQEQVVRMPSVGLMDRFQTLAKNIRKQSWPDYFKDQYIQEASDIICDPSQGATVKIVEKTARMVNKNNVPTEYLTKQKLVGFDLVKELKKLVTADESNLTPDDLLIIYGLQDYEGLDEAVEKVKESIKKDETRREQAGGAEPEAEAEAESDEAQEAIEKAEAEAEQATDQPLPAIEEGEAPTSLSQMVSTFIQSASIFKRQAEAFIGKVDEIDTDPQVMDKWGSAYEDAFIALAKVGLEAYGKQDLLSLLEQAEESD